MHTTGSSLRPYLHRLVEHDLIVEHRDSIDGSTAATFVHCKLGNELHPIEYWISQFQSQGNKS